MHALVSWRMRRGGSSTTPQSRLGRNQARDRQAMQLSVYVGAESIAASPAAIVTL
jgi:hypothetical protein